MMMKIYSKTTTHGGGGMSTIKRPKKPTFQQITNAELVIGLYDDGRIRILKDRFTGNPTSLSGRASIEEAVNKSSLIISHGVFGENNLKMFIEGLAIEIEKSIHETIEKFHKKKNIPRK